MEKISFTLIDPQDGKLLFKLFQFEDNSHFDHLQRNNYFTIIFINEGSGKIKADFNEYLYPEKSIFFFSPYQPYIIYPENSSKGIAIHFHSDFFCIYRYPSEVAAYNYLFNSVYQSPFIVVNDENEKYILQHIHFMVNELRHQKINKNEILISYLKIILINASRLKQSNSDHVEIESDQGKNVTVAQN